MSNGMVGGGLEWTPRCFLFSIQRTRLGRRLRAIEPASSAVFPAKSRSYVVWRATGTPFGFIPTKFGVVAMQATPAGVPNNW